MGGAVVLVGAFSSTLRCLCCRCSETQIPTLQCSNGKLNVLYILEVSIGRTWKWFSIRYAPTFVGYHTFQMQRNVKVEEVPCEDVDEARA